MDSDYNDAVTINKGHSTLGNRTYDVFIAVHVESLGHVAKELKTAIEALGRSAFLCITDIPGGAGFREEIVRAVKSCKVFVPLMNQQWAMSGECEDEFLLAKRLNLTSHERKATALPSARRPVILPVAFPSLEPWYRFPHVELLAASLNFVLAPMNDALDKRTIKMAASMAVKLCSDNTDVNSLIVTHSGASLVNFGSLQNALDTLGVYLQQASTILAGANALSTKKAHLIPKGDGKEGSFPPPRAKYIGFSYGHVDDYVETIFSLELRVRVLEDKIHERTAPVEGSVLFKLCSFTILPGDTDSTMANHLRKLGEDDYAEIDVAGTYSFEHGLLRLEDRVVKHDTIGFTSVDRWKQDAYRLLVSPSDAREITGTLRGWSGEWDIAFRAEAF